MFMLTPMTGKEAAESRTVIISGFEVGFKTFVICCLAAFPGLILAIIFYPFLGSGALLMFPLAIGGCLYLFQSRSREGLKLRTWQTMVDKKKASVNQFFMCGVVIDLDDDGEFTVAANTVPAAGTVLRARPDAPTYGTNVYADELIGAAKGRYDVFSSPKQSRRASKKSGPSRV